MPPLTRRFIKLGMVYLVAALLVGLILAARYFWAAPRFVYALEPSYFHLFMVGWVLQLIFGVIYWMFPKYSQAQPHGSERVWQATFWLLNIGLLLRVIAEPMNTLNGLAVWDWLLVTSALLQGLAALLFVTVTWNRVKGR